MSDQSKRQRIDKTPWVLCIVKELWITAIIPMLDVYALTHVWVFHKKNTISFQIPDKLWLERSQKLEHIIRTFRIDYLKLQRSHGRVTILSLTPPTGVELCIDYCRVVYKALGKLRDPKMKHLDRLSNVITSTNYEELKYGTRCHNLNRLICENKIAYEGTEMECKVLLGFIMLIPSIVKSGAIIESDGVVEVPLNHIVITEYCNRPEVIQAAYGDVTSLGTAMALVLKLKGLMSYNIYSNNYKISLNLSDDGTRSIITNIRDFEIISYEHLRGDRSYCLVDYSKVINEYHPDAGVKQRYVLCKTCNSAAYVHQPSSSYPLLK